ncbi:MAG: protein translocase subunit SecD [Opitutales bacterium]|tara:strand:+ start:606 stop:3194 length:2589 start_codon:yes stop_codon:yes gene_type:complete
MRGNILWKFLLTAVVLVWAVISIYPLEDTPFETYIQERATADQAGFAAFLDKAQAYVDAGHAPTLFVAMSDLANQDKVNLAKYFPDVNLADVRNFKKRNEILLAYLLQQSQGKIKLGLDLQGGVAFTLKVDESALKGQEAYEREQRLNKAIEIMGNRVNGLGVVDPVIRASGDNRIEIQLPGVTTRENPDALASLQKPAKLTFHRVNRNAFPATTPAGETPPGYILMEEDRENPTTGEVIKDALFVKRVPDMAGGMVKQAFVSPTDFGGFQVNLTLTNKGAQRFREITKQIADENNAAPYKNMSDGNPGKYGRLAIVLDGMLYSAPRVTEEIPGGQARITGQFSQREAFELSNVLNNPLEFELKVDEMYEVGPTLAEDARTSSIKAALLGAGLVVIFMLVYYLVPGVTAVLSIVLNILIVLAVMASLGATLTLPGVAALVLTIGMAVDASILIFERIREELHEGKGVKHALQAGYEKAFSTIVDANVTTLLTACILIWLGTGPVKGFGVTLAIGIVATMFCALITNRFLLEILVSQNILKKMFHYSLFRTSKFDFMKWRRPAFVCSWIIVIMGMVAVGIKGKHIYGIDFLGGEELTLEFSEKLPINDIYALASDKNLGEVTPIYQTLLGEEKELLKIQTESDHGDRVFTAMQEAFPQAKLKLIGENRIGASVSKNIQFNALLAIGMSLLGILLYVAFRFEFGYGVGAVISTLHDVLMTVGIFVLCGGQFTAPMVAAVLMIVGYSINDTIIVFDRIREELVLNPTTSLFKIINLAVNKTLSRTLLTSLTTFLAAFSLYVFGSGEIKDFSFVFILGILTGTFSSIFVASPIFYWWHKGDRRHVEERELLPKYEWDASSKASRKG